MGQEVQTPGASRGIYRNQRNRWAAGVWRLRPAGGAVPTRPGRWGMVGG